MVAVTVTDVWWIDGVIIAGAVVAALATVWQRFLGPAVARPIARAVVREIGEALQPSIDKSISKALKPVYRELTANGGDSLKDRVRITDRRLSRIEEHLGLSEVETGVPDDRWDEPGGTPI